MRIRSLPVIQLSIGCKVIQDYGTGIDGIILSTREHTRGPQTRRRDLTQYGYVSLKFLHIVALLATIANFQINDHVTIQSYNFNVLYL